MYIPDLTERYPEGFRCYDEPDYYDYGYEPSYEELVVTDSDYADTLAQWMKEDPVGTQQLINKYRG